MPRNYKPQPGAKRYKKHGEEVMKKALEAIDKGVPYRKVEERFNIPRSVLQRHYTSKDIKPHGGQVALGAQFEKHLVNRLVLCAEWGYPMDTFDLRCIVKAHLDRRGVNHKCFKNNMPGKDWATSFLKRHKEYLAHRMCQNIKRYRAGVSPEIINEFFDNLQDALKDIPASNIMNYDETNLADDPGRRKVIAKRGSKYPERIINSTKSANSIMYAGCADGSLLPPYIVYKATNIYDTWTFGGPQGARYNRTKSGWFDLQCFEDWFHSIALPYLKKLPGKKMLIGDNLSSHLSASIVEKCEENEIAFCFLPANSTHLLQPLDVAFFSPLKKAWRTILENWKKGPGRKQATVAKDNFPQLLKQLTEKIKANANSNLIAGFTKCGLVPLNRNKVLDRIPNSTNAETTSTEDMDSTEISEIDASFLEVLKEKRYGDEGEQTRRKRKRKIDIAPGKSIRGADFLEAQSNSDHETSGTVAHPSPAVDYSSEDSESDDQNIPCHSRGDGEADTTLQSMAVPETNARNKIKPRKYDVGDYVIFEYERELFPGEVTYVEEGGCNIKSMAKSGVNWKWPAVEDEMFYENGEIKQKINPPKKLNRGVMVVNELKKRWGC